MTEQQFYNYSLFLEKVRGWHRDRKFTLFKEKYGVWVSSRVKSRSTPRQPSKEFLDYLYWVDRSYVNNTLNILDDYDDDIFIKTLDLNPDINKVLDN